MPRIWARRLRGRVLPTGTVRAVAQGAGVAAAGLSPKAPGGCRTPPPRCPRGCSAMSRGQQRRRPLRRARRQDRAARRCRRAGHRGRPLAGAARAAARKSRAAWRSRPKPSRPTSPNGRPSRSTRCCSMRPARRPAPSAAIPTCPGSSARPTSRRSPRCSTGCSTRAAELVQARRPAGLLRLLAGAGGRRSSQVAALLAREPALRRAADRGRRGRRPGRAASTPAGDLRTLPCHLPDPDSRMARARRLLCRRGSEVRAGHGPRFLPTAGDFRAMLADVDTPIRSIGIDVMPSREPTRSAASASNE